MPSSAKSRALKRAAAKARAEANKKARLEAAAAKEDSPKQFEMRTHFKGLPVSSEALEDYRSFEDGSKEHLWIRLATLKAGFRAQSDTDAIYVDFFEASPEMRAVIMNDMESHHEVMPSRATLAFLGSSRKLRSSEPVRTVRSPRRSWTATLQSTKPRKR